MHTKEEILKEIQRTTRENDGSPLGTARLEEETGINPYDWGRYWANLGDAVREAGFEPNQFQGPLPDQLFIAKIIGLSRKLGRFPTSRDFLVEKTNDPDLPSRNSFQRFGTKEKRALKVAEYCKDKADLQDVLELCAAVLSKSPSDHTTELATETTGEVYLAKSGRYYKIGKTNDTVRRGNELRIQLPEKIDLVHSIKTDDPGGVEAYWHRRFESTRKGGEWFDLTPRDVKAFKRWRRIY
jgi:hypothetical protein